MVLDNKVQEWGPVGFAGREIAAGIVPKDLSGWLVPGVQGGVVVLPVGNLRERIVVELTFLEWEHLEWASRWEPQA